MRADDHAAACVLFRAGGRLADGTLRAILHALSAEPQKAYAFALSGAAKEQFCRLAEAYAQYHLGRGFDSLQFYKSVSL